MSLATRCPACHTSFRVVQDQLKVSQGWVRCGRCSEVFNALEALFDLDAEGDGAQAGRVLAELSRHAPPPVADGVAAGAGTPAGPITAGPSADEPRLLPREAERIATAPPAPARPPPAVPMPSADDAAREAAADADAGVVSALDEGEAAPDFVRRAERAARWQRPGVRVALAAAALALVLLLLAQVGVAQRDLLAARWPGLKPLLAALCVPSGCRIEPLRRIERIVVDATGLTRVEGAPLYRLSVVLHNKGDLPLRVPAVDLTLSDPQGRPLARRVLQAAELGAGGDTIGPGADLPLQALLTVGERRLSGYTVEIFYP